MARINKMHISAGERADMVKRAKSIWTCAFSPSRDEGSEWCALCGYHCDSHLKNVVTE